MKVSTAELERLDWRRKRRRITMASTMLEGLLITKLGATPSESPPVTRILGTWVFHDDEPVTMLDEDVGTEIKLAMREWVDRTHGGGISKAHREVAELQWIGGHFWFVTF